MAGKMQCNGTLYEDILHIDICSAYLFVPNILIGAPQSLIHIETLLVVVDPGHFSLSLVFTLHELHDEWHSKHECQMQPRVHEVVKLFDLLQHLRVLLNSELAFEKPKQFIKVILLLG